MNKLKILNRNMGNKLYSTLFTEKCIIKHCNIVNKSQYIRTLQHQYIQ